MNVVEPKKQFMNYKFTVAPHKEEQDEEPSKMRPVNQIGLSDEDDSDQDLKYQLEQRPEYQAVKDQAALKEQIRQQDHMRSPSVSQIGPSNFIKTKGKDLKQEEVEHMEHPSAVKGASTSRDKQVPAKQVQVNNLIQPEPTETTLV